MAGTSDVGYHSSRIYRCWLAETIDGRETARDELSNRSSINHENAQTSLNNLPLSLDSLEPYIGMEFESAEGAREFYEQYGRHVGFTIRNNRTRRSLKDNSIIGREFVCSKEGFPNSNKENKAHHTSRSVTREGCNAMLRISAKDGGKWIIYGFVKDHSHELNPSKVPPRRAHRIAFCEDKKDLKIRELCRELHRERKRCVAYQAQLQMILEYVEEHNRQLSLKIEGVFNNLEELESEEPEEDIDTE